MGIARKHVAVLIAIFSVTAALVHVATWRWISQTLEPDWRAIAYEFGGWHGADAAFDPVYGEDPSQTSLLRVYGNGNGENVVAYIGYYGDLAKILELHTPERCYSGQGWKTLSTGDSAVGTFRGKTIPAKEMIVEKAGKRRLVLWWYMAGPRPFKNRIRYIYAMLVMSTFTGRKDGALVRFETSLEPGQEAVAKERAEKFATAFQAELDKALPR